MLNWIGAILVLAGGTGAGLRAANELGRRSDVLSAFLAALDQLEAELCFRLTPMPELLARLADGTDGEVSRFFARCQNGLHTLGETSFSAVWNRALAEENLPLAAEDRLLLEQLGAVLGQYDLEGQRGAIESIRSRLGHCLESARERHRSIGRVYRALGACAGLRCVLLLI